MSRRATRPERRGATHLDPVLVLGVHVLVWLNDHVARAHLSRHRELDPLLGDSDGDGVAQDGQVAADALELLGRHLDRALVVGVRDPQVLRVDVHELELKVRDAVGVLVLEHEVHRVAVLVRLESHDVVIVAALEYLPGGWDGGRVDMGFGVGGYPGAPPCVEQGSGQPLRRYGRACAGAGGSERNEPRGHAPAIRRPGGLAHARARGAGRPAGRPGGRRRADAPCPWSRG
eukprot:scaffold5777_cov101-Isochrysis_galbana.AAC.5